MIMSMTKGPHCVTRDGAKVSPILPGADEAFAWLQRHQPMSVDWALTYEGYKINAVGSAPWPADEAASRRRAAVALITGDADHRAGHPSADGDADMLRMVQENCGACALAGVDLGDDGGPNYASWERVYVEAGRPVPRRWERQFVAALNPGADGNEGYAAALAGDLATWGVRWSD